MPWIRPTPDEELVRRMRRGEERAFTALYRRHQRAVYGYALLSSASEEVAADATQETFIHLMRSADGWDATRGSLGAWLCGVARNLVRRHHHAFDAAVETPDEDEEAAWEAVPYDAPEHALERSRLADAVSAALQRLEPHHRDIVVLCELQERSYADAALICGIEVGTVRSRLSRAKARLADLLREHRPAAQREAA